MDEKVLMDVLQTAVKTGKFIAGLEEASQSLKGSKLVIYSTMMSSTKVNRIVEACRSASVPAVRWMRISRSGI